MIFVTVGTQLPFDRLVRAVDEWAGRRGTDVFAQIGTGAYAPKHGRWARLLSVDACREQLRRAHAVVAHAGMGSILTALELGKPILVMPRRADLGEHRNDHQIATARQFRQQGRIRVALDAEELWGQLDAVAASDPMAERIAPAASPTLIGALRDFAHRMAQAQTGTAAPWRAASAAG